MKEANYLINPEFEAYSEQMSRKQDEILYALYRETNLKVLRPRMLTGHLQGLFLEFISKLMRPACILEIGTYTGYGTICLSRGMQSGGKIHTIEKNPEVLEYARKYFTKEGIAENVIIHNADALQTLSSLQAKLDLVYIDGDKSQYPEYIKAIKPLMNSGAVIMLDNVLWDGKVLKDEPEDPETAALQEANRMIQDDPDFDNFLLPLRDGLMIARKS